MNKNSISNYFFHTKTINDNTKSVNSLIALTNNRIATCSNDNTIRIYDTVNNFHCDDILARHNTSIMSIC